MTQWLLHAPSMSFLTSCNRDAHRFYIDVQMCRCDLQRDVGNSANDSRQLRAAQVIVLHGFRLQMLPMRTKFSRLVLFVTLAWCGF